MQIIVVVEALENGRFRARAYAPLNAVGEGNSADAAVANLRYEIDLELRSGKELVTIEIDVPMLTN